MISITENLRMIMQICMDAAKLQTLYIHLKKNQFHAIYWIVFGLYEG